MTTEDAARKETVIFYYDIDLNLKATYVGTREN
jgi:hypothetical protein